MDIRSDVPDEQLVALTEHAAARVRRRAQCVLMAKDGRSAENIAASLDCSRATVYRWISLFNQLGTQGLEINAANNGARFCAARKEPKIRQRIAELVLQSGRRITLKRIDELLRDEFDIQYATLGGVQQFVARLGIKRDVPQPQSHSAKSRAD